MFRETLTIRRPGAIPTVRRVQAKTAGRGVLQTKQASPHVRACTSSTIQAYREDPWQTPAWDGTFRVNAQAAIGAEWHTARHYQKGPKSKRVAVVPENTFAAYGVLVYQSDNNVASRIIFGARLSGNPSNSVRKMYADHSVRLTNYNVDCAEYYIIKQARRMIPMIRYREGHNPRPSLYVYTDHSPCPKCQEDFDRLQEDFGDLELVLMWEQRYMEHQEDEIWEIPDGERIVGIVPPEDPTDISGQRRPSVADEADGWVTVGGRKK